MMAEYWAATGLFWKAWLAIGALGILLEWLDGHVQLPRGGYKR